MTKFVAIDVETANPSLASICQVGIVTFEHGEVTEAWDCLVNPEDYFDAINVSIHGIDERRVRRAPTFPQIFGEIAKRLGDQVAVSHTPFDRTSLHAVLGKYRLPSVQCGWLDSARVVRRAWPQFAYSGYGLSSICAHLDIDFEHHDAKEDARAAGRVLLAAMQQSGLDLNGWIHRVRKPILDVEPISRSGNPDGPLVGELVVFTGTLSVTRSEAADLAARAGCDVAPNVTKATTLLVVGDQDIAKLAGHDKSRKHRRAEELIREGRRIRILRESDFISMIGLDDRLTVSPILATQNNHE